jgi:hypothetical protein
VGTVTELGFPTAAAASGVVALSVFVSDGVWGAAASPACVGTLHWAGAYEAVNISEHASKKPVNLFVLFKIARRTFSCFLSGSLTLPKMQTDYIGSRNFLVWFKS